jgi:hypothetical protein
MCSRVVFLVPANLVLPPPAGRGGGVGEVNILDRGDEVEVVRGIADDWQGGTVHAEGWCDNARLLEEPLGVVERPQYP